MEDKELFDRYDDLRRFANRVKLELLEELYDDFVDFLADKKDQDREGGSNMYWEGFEVGFKEAIRLIASSKAQYWVD